MANPSRAADPQFPAPSLFTADGTVLLGFIPAQIGMDADLQFSGAPMGNLVGSVTIDGHPSTTDCGQTFSDDGVLNTVTIRDAAGTVLTVIPPGTAGTPVPGIRMPVDNPGFPGDDAATPVP